MNEIFRVTEFIRSYIDDLLVITKGDWYVHLDEVELVLKNFRAYNLKCNIKKLYFGQIDMEYLGFLGRLERGVTDK